MNTITYNVVWNIEYKSYESSQTDTALYDDFLKWELQMGPDIRLGAHRQQSIGII